MGNLQTQWAASRVKGLIIATMGGALTLLSFFVLPYVSLGSLGSATGVQIADFLNSMSSLASTLGSSSGSSQFSGGAFALWAQAILAGVAAGIGGYQWNRTRQPGGDYTRSSVVGMLICGGISGLIGLYMYAALGQYAGVLGFGYYAMILGAIAVVGGAIYQLRS